MMMRGATELETHIVSVERMKEYYEITPEVSFISYICSLISNFGGSILNEIQLF